jgi:replication factor A1
MHTTKDTLYEFINDLKTKKEFEEEIKKRTQDCDGLFDEDTIALFIVDELGRNKQAITKIADLKANSDSTIEGEITNIYDSKEFTRKNGTSGKVLNLDITDDTGTCRLVLWNKDVEQINSKKIQKGTKLKIINGYTKDGYSGLEIHLGKWGLLETIQNNTTENKNIKSEEINEIEGTLISREPTKAFFKDSGEFGFVTTIKINIGNEEKQITIWDANVKEIQKYKIGDKIQIKDISKKQYNGKTEIHVNGNGTIKKA